MHFLKKATRTGPQLKILQNTSGIHGSLLVPHLQQPFYKIQQRSFSFCDNMADPEDFKNIRMKFQRDTGGNLGGKPMLQAKPGPKPAIPAKPTIQPNSERCFQKPVPKALSSPDLAVSPKSDPLKAAGSSLCSHESFSYRRNSRILPETLVDKPSVPLNKPTVPKLSANSPLNKNSGNPSLHFSQVKRPPIEYSNKPRLKLLPSEAVLGVRPKKPARPPIVDLEKFQEPKEADDYDDYMIMRSFLDSKQQKTRLTTSQSQPNLTTCFPTHSVRNSFGGSSEINESTLPRTPERKHLSTSLQHVVITETEAPDEVYDDVDVVLGRNNPTTSQMSSQTLVEQNVLITNWRNETNLKKLQKQEQEFRRRFQFHGEIKVLTRMMVDPNAIIQKPGYKDLAYTRGEILDVIQLTGSDKILCRNFEGKFGYVPRKAVLSIEKNIYSNVNTDEIYDNTDLISNKLPAVAIKPRFQNGYVARLLQRNPSNKSKPPLPKRENSKSKNEDKELKELRKKFKIQGEIRVLTHMMVVPSAGNKRGGGKELSISKGEILEVIQFTNEEKLLCRNSKGKYGYVKRRYVLQLEKEIYDDVGISGSGITQQRR
ncbi:FYN-binding protein 1-like isoform X2 [Hyla sarda]|uniref:FYN-binding protein 1-like isoform X2 n=1 Tax=Hyla sarda TaxID=327740 RepID=UPI0024C23342|nr:FYN-binding protein 1-like isoform X2 [Hyla sarda]